MIKFYAGLILFLLIIVPFYHVEGYVSSYKNELMSFTCPHYKAVIDSIENGNGCFFAITEDCDTNVTVSSTCPGFYYIYDKTGSLDPRNVLVPTNTSWKEIRRLEQESKKQYWPSWTNFSIADAYIYECIDSKCRETQLAKEFINTPTGTVLKNWELKFYSIEANQDVVVKGKTVFYTPNNQIDPWLVKQKKAHGLRKLFIVIVISLSVLFILINTIYFSVRFVNRHRIRRDKYSKTFREYITTGFILLLVVSIPFSFLTGGPFGLLWFLSQSCDYGYSAIAQLLLVILVDFIIFWRMKPLYKSSKYHRLKNLGFHLISFVLALTFVWFLSIIGVPPKVGWCGT